MASGTPTATAHKKMPRAITVLAPKRKPTTITRAVPIMKIRSLRIRHWPTAFVNGGYPWRAASN
jgi:hypothetical protein